MRNFLFVGLASILVTSLGCDGSSPGGQCASFTPCGGALVGTWQINGVCITAPDAGASTSPCGSAVSRSNMQYQGSFTFRSDSTYSIAISVSGTSQVTYSAECLTSFGMSCAAISSLLAAGADAGVSGSCSSTSSGGCSCSENISNVSSPEDGTYTTSGTSFSTTPSSSSASPATADYCVQGNRLTIGVNDSGGSMVITATK